MKTFRRYLLLLLLLLPGIGCVEEVVWLPDSSGFIHTTGAGHRTIAYYKLATETWQVVVADSRANSRRPAISEDGQQIAVVRSQSETHRTIVQVLVYNRSGEIVHQSNRVVFRTDPKITPAHELNATKAYWVLGQPIIVFEDGQGIGIYNLDERTFNIVDNCLLASELDYNFSPIRPDGRGFVASSPNPEKVDEKGLFFRTWSGTETRARWDTTFVNFFKSHTARSVHWEDKVMVITFSDFSSAEFNTDTGDIRIRKERSTPPVSVEGVDEILTLKKSYLASKFEGGGGKNGEVTIVSGSLSEHTVSKIIDNVRASDVRFFRSPNERFAVARIVRSEEPEKIIYIVFSDTGGVCNILPASIPVRARLPVVNKDRSKGTPHTYTVVAPHLCDEILPMKAENVPEKNDFSQALSQAKAAQLDLNRAKTDKGDIGFIASEASKAMLDLIDSRERIAVLPEPPGIINQSVEGFILGYAGQLDLAIEQGAKYQAQQEEIQAEARKVALAAQRLNAAKLLLPRVAKEHSGPAIESGQACIINYLAQWGRNFESDVLGVQQNLDGNMTLNNCTLLVEVRNETGDVARNVHFIREWKPQQKLFAKYRPGVSFGTGTAVCRQTVDDPKSITVSLWSDELSQENMVYPITPSDKSDKIRRYCNDLNIRIEYRPYQAGFFGHNRGAVATMTGINQLPTCEVKVTFIAIDNAGNVTQTRQQSWRLNEWRRGQTITFSDSKLDIDPNRIDVTISFPDTDYVYNNSFTLSQ